MERKREEMKEMEAGELRRMTGRARKEKRRVKRRKGRKEGRKETRKEEVFK